MSFRRFGSATADAEYTYDPLDRVATQTDERGQTTYSYLGTSDNVSSEISTAGTTSYSYGPDGDRVGMTTTRPPWAGDYYFLRNVHTDISLLIGANASEATASYVYKPYGGRDQLSTGDAEDSSLLNPYRFDDKRFDPGSSTLDMTARRYSSDIGRFFGEDTDFASEDNLDLTTESTTQNRYAFAAADPVQYIETDGHVFVPGPCRDPRPCPPRPKRNRYVKPFPTPRRFFHGIDQGVDYETHEAAKAVTSGVIYYRSGTDHWEGHGALYEHFRRSVRINGQRYYSVYYAEEDPLVAGGKESGARNVHVGVGQPVIKKGPRYPYTELGFARGPWGHTPFADLPPRT